MPVVVTSSERLACRISHPMRGVNVGYEGCVLLVQSLVDPHCDERKLPWCPLPLSPLSLKVGAVYYASPHPGQTVPLHANDGQVATRL